MLVNIQFLRFLAALAVVLFHMDPLFKSSHSIFHTHLFGFAGVDVFFVISGFIMWHTTRNSQSFDDASRFLKRRFVRIYTGYWPYFLIALVLFWVLDPLALEKKSGVESFLLTPMPISERLIPVSWTLTFELFFYVLFSALMLLDRKWLPYIVSALVLLLIAVNTLGWMFFSFYTAEFLRETPRLLRIIISPYVIEFLLGCLLCHYATVGHLRWGAVSLLLSLLLFAGGGYLNAEVFENRMDTGYFVVQRVAVFGLAAVLLVYGAVALESRQLLLFPKVSLLLGGASYSLYLSHTLIIDLFARTGLVQTSGSLPTWIIWAILLLIIILYSVFHYLYVERPFYAAGRRLLVDR